jgi:prepilin-type N-terminal cleavage/methylation domain-containing protein
MSIVGMKISQSVQGFTLIELLFVMMIIGILSGIFAPQVSLSLRRAQDAANKGNLGIMRSTIGVFYASHDGQFPTDNLTSLVPALLSSIPTLHTLGQHLESNQVIAETALTDSGMWSYDNVPDDPGLGSVYIGCTHTDLSGTTWSAY